jgi:hypothetical protein
MNNAITTYDDLIQEKQRLKELLLIQKNQIRADLKSLKEEFNPVMHVASLVNKLITREDTEGTVAATGTNITIDLLTSRLFAKSNFLVRFLVPVLLKNLSSHYVPKAVPALKKIIGKKSVKQES